jgi:hypothetical protein
LADDDDGNRGHDAVTIVDPIQCSAALLQQQRHISAMTFLMEDTDHHSNNNSNTNKKKPSYGPLYPSSRM